MAISVGLEVGVAFTEAVVRLHCVNLSCRAAFTARSDSLTPLIYSECVSFECRRLSDVPRL